MRVLRGIVIGAGVVLALVVQVSLLPHVAWRGIVPDLGLLVVVAAGLARDERFAMVVGFGTGLLLDLAPPADHVAGRHGATVGRAVFAHRHLSRERVARRPSHWQHQ